MKDRIRNALHESGLLAPVYELVVRSPLWPLLHPRRIHVYGVGAPKTGTTSLAKIFSPHYQAGHEAHTPETKQLLQERKSGALTGEPLAEAMRQRDRKRRLECESAHYLAHFCDVLAEAFPRAKFILTVREPRAWLRSVIDEIMGAMGRVGETRRQFFSPSSSRNYTTVFDIYFGFPEAYSRQEKALAEHELDSVSGYLLYWSRHNDMVLDAVPPERLLVLRTRDISDEIERIAVFAGVPAPTLNPGSRHENKTSSRYGVVSEVGEEYIQSKIDEHCAETMARLEQEAGVSLK